MSVTPGTYQLLIRLRRPAMITVGALGCFRFPAGWYVYTGSAKNGLTQRIRRHLRQDKRKHWHIDYLLAAADGVEAFVLPGSTTSECELHSQLRGGQVLVPGFGSSDCGCESHLVYFRKWPAITLVSWGKFLRLHDIQPCCPRHRSTPR